MFRFNYFFANPRHKVIDKKAEAKIKKTSHVPQ
jgi:hypothetical protein